MTTVAAGALAVALSFAPVAQAQNEAKATEPTPTQPQCGPAGNHALLERMTAAFGLTCDQKFQIEPYLHDEESVSKPLLSFAAFTQEEKQAMMLQIKLAARQQIKPMLTPDQQKKMDEDIASVAGGGNGAKGGGSKNSKNAKKPPKVVDPFDGEEALCAALNKYSALSADQKQEMILQVKKAARREGAPQLTPEQEKKIDADIQQLSANAKAKAKK
jgi:hypothetical protein